MLPSNEGLSEGRVERVQPVSSYTGRVPEYKQRTSEYSGTSERYSRHAVSGTEPARQNTTSSNINSGISTGHAYIQNNMLTGDTSQTATKNNPRSTNQFGRAAGVSRLCRQQDISETRHTQDNDMLPPKNPLRRYNSVSTPATKPQQPYTINAVNGSLGRNQRTLSAIGKQQSESSVMYHRHRVSSNMRESYSSSRATRTPVETSAISNTSDNVRKRSLMTPTPPASAEITSSMYSTSRNKRTNQDLFTSTDRSRKLSNPTEHLTPRNSITVHNNQSSLARSPPSSHRHSASSNRRGSRIPRFTAGDRIHMEGIVTYDEYTKLKRKYEDLKQKVALLEEDLKSCEEAKEEVMVWHNDLAEKSIEVINELEDRKVELENAEAQNFRYKKEIAYKETENSELKKKLKSMFELVLYSQASSGSPISSDCLPSPIRSQNCATEMGTPQHIGADSHIPESVLHDIDNNYSKTDWKSSCDVIAKNINSLHKNYKLAHPNSELDSNSKNDLDCVEKYIKEMSEYQADTSSAIHEGSADNNVGNAEPSDIGSDTSIQRDISEQEEHSKRRRSTMLFGNLIRPSTGPSVSTEMISRSKAQLRDGAEDCVKAILVEMRNGSSTAARNLLNYTTVSADPNAITGYSCARCRQLAETMYLLVKDNDYYREARDKLQNGIADVVSRHNSLVHLLERERKHYREIRANALIEGTREAVRERVRMETQQRSELEDIIQQEARNKVTDTVDDDLAHEFARALTLNSYHSTSSVTNSRRYNASKPISHTSTSGEIAISEGAKAPLLKLRN